MAYDNNDILQTLVTKTATFQSAGFNLKTGTPRRGQVARFLLNSYSSPGTAGAVWTASIEESDDNTAFSTLAAAPPVTCATAAASKELFVPFATVKKYIRAVMTLTTNSGTPSVAYLVDLGIARP